VRVSEFDVPQRLIVGAAAATRFAGGVLMGTGLAFYIGQSGGSDLAVSLVATAYFGAIMLFAPVWGAIADVTGRRRALLVGTGLASTLPLLVLFVRDGTAVALSVRALYAVFAAGFPPVMLGIVSARGGDDGRGRSLGFYNSARSVGFTGGQISVGLILGLFAPSGLYLVIAAFSLASTLAVALVDDVAPKPDREPSLSEVAVEVRRRLLPAPEDRRHLRRNGLRWLYVALGLRNVTVVGVFSLLPVYLPNGLGFSEFQMGALLAINPAGQAVFMYLFGRVADTTGRKPLITVGMGGSAVFAVVAAAAALPGTIVGRFVVALASLLIIAASFSALTTGALAFIGDVAPADRESELMGLRSTAKGFGGTVGPILFGAVATVTNYETSFAVGSLLGFLATAIVAVTLIESYESPSARAVPSDD
jgi:MFS family permease